MPRKSYDASFEELARSVDIVGEARPHVERCPRADDDEPGPSIFRTVVQDVSLEDLTLPGLFVGRARLRSVSFAGSDLHLSTFSRSDLADCSFSNCDLSRVHLRACFFTGCSFRGADLARADLRGSRFEGCDFAAANLQGALLLRRPGWLWRVLGWGLPSELAGPDQSRLPFSGEQRAQVHWSDRVEQPRRG